MEIKILDRILKANDAMAAGIRQDLADRGILALNLLGSPGGGKTALLEQTLGRLDQPAAVIEGDIATSRDAERLSRFNLPIIQVQTELFGGACHLDAGMIRPALDRLGFAGPGYLFIENVGNLVCPADFDLGEDAKVLVFSVAEGTDKPLKYPAMVRVADLGIVNKADLAGPLEVDPDEMVQAARRVKPDLDILTLSSRTGAGLDAWLDWLRAAYARKFPAVG